MEGETRELPREGADCHFEWYSSEMTPRTGGQRRFWPRRMVGPRRVVHIAGVYGEWTELHPPKGSTDSYFASWGATMARRLATRYPNLDVEVWHTDPESRRVTWVEKHGVRAAGFPVVHCRPNSSLTAAMVSRLKSYQREGELLVHFHTVHNPAVAFLSFALPGTRVVAQHHGDLPPSPTSARGMCKHLLERVALRRLHAITYLTSKERDYLERLVPAARLHFLPMGADFDFILPQDKRECRRALGLDPDGVYGLYVGRFYRLKGVDLMLHAHRELGRRYGFKALFVGGKRTPVNDLFSEVENSGCPYFEAQPWSRMPIFYGACDFLMHLGFRYNGFDVACCEALAAGRPLLTSNFKFMPGDTSRLGISVPSESEFIPRCEQMLRSFSTFDRCRESARPMYSVQAIVDRLYHQVYGFDRGPTPGFAPGGMT